MTRHLVAFVASFAALWSLSCTGRYAIGNEGPRALTTIPPPAEPPRTGPTRARPAEAAVPREWLDGICDRVEDCAVERNAELARTSGGTTEDEEAARRDAQSALVSGAVRSFCLLRTGRLEPRAVQRIHGCARTTMACPDFYRCADFPGARKDALPPRPPGSGATPGGR